MDKKISNKISPDIRNHEEVSAEFEYLPRLKKMPDTDLHRMGSKDVQRSESIGDLSDVDLEEETYRLPNVTVNEEVSPEFEYLPRLKKMPDTDLHRMGSTDVQRSVSIGDLSDVDLEEDSYGGKRKSRKSRKSKRKSRKSKRKSRKSRKSLRRK